MNAPLIQKELSPPASCRFAQRLLYVSVGFCLLVMIAMGMHIFLYSPGLESAASAMQAFSLSEIALWSAGSPERNPETIHPGVDLRMIPLLEIGP